MKELIKSLQLKHAHLLILERLLRNTDTSHPRNARRLQQIRDEIKTLQIQMDMIDVLCSIEQEIKKKGDGTNATDQDESAE